MRKRILALALMLCMMLSILPMTALAAPVSSGKCGDNLTWTLDADGVLTITGTGEMAHYNDYDTALGAYVIGNSAWNQANPAVKRVVIGEGVTLVGSGAFYGCSQLAEVQLPGTLDRICTYAFQNCTALAEITIPASVTSLDTEAFRGCSALAKINVHKDNAKYYTDDRGVLYSHDVNPSMGWDIYSLVLAPVSLSGEYEIFDKVTNIYVAAFEDCTKLTGVVIPDSIDTITSYAFSGCTSLASFTIPAGVWAIEEGAFHNCTALKSVTFPGSRPFMFNDKAFTGVTAYAYYPEGDASWNEYTMVDYGGKLTWLPIGATPPAGVEGVTRVFGADRYATSFKAADTLKAELGVSKFQNIIVASGTGFADALAGSYLAAVKEAPILLVRGANVNDVKAYIKNNLTAGGTVYLLGGVNAVPKAMESGLDSFNVKRLGGADRYETNLLILKEAGVGNKDIIVCTGLNFADSLSASASGLPILLVKGGLTDSQKAFLKGTSGKKIIVGGTSAVSAAVESQLKTYGSVKRLAGATRYDTSVLVAKEFFSAPKSAVLAYAQNFPDGLSGGPLAYALNAPLILTDSGKPTAAVNYATGLGIKNGYVLGGTGLISDNVAKSIFSMNENDVITVK